MDSSTTWPWAALLLLGATHGVNPGMGWLFAVGRGLQERRRGAVWSTLGPLAIGHALAMVAALLLLAAVDTVLPASYLRWVVAAALVAVAVQSLVRHRHPRWGGMRMGARELTAWSFLVASAHGAGLMALPFILRLASASTPAATLGHSHAGHGMQLTHAALAASAPPAVSLVAVVLHTAGYLLVTAVVSAIVFERLGLRLLRTMWVNVDIIWAIALIATAVLSVVV